PPTARPAASRRPEAMARAPRSPPHIQKFGGASRADAAGITHAAKIVLAHHPAPQVVVVSAMGGVTDALLDCAARAARGDAAHVRTSARTHRARPPEAARTLGPLLARGAVTVIPGFLGAAPDGQVATLGRGGSDLTATLLARVLGAREVSLWKDVPGLLTADPRIVPDARVVPQVHLREAA